MKIDTKIRSTAPELMDDFSMHGPVLTDALDKIAMINKLLGGNKVTLDGIELLMAKSKKKDRIKIIDIGCGNGAMLRMLSDYACKNGFVFELLGLDANQATIDHAKNLSKGYADIGYLCEDIFDENNRIGECDILLFTLTLHHFSDFQLVSLIEKLRQDVQLGIVVNDLHRSVLAYKLFGVLSRIFSLNYMSREDGLISILRGFKRSDLMDYEKQLGIESAYIKWKWAFRYLWIIKTK